MQLTLVMVVAMQIGCAVSEHLVFAVVQVENNYEQTKKVGDSSD